MAGINFVGSIVGAENQTLASGALVAGGVVLLGLVARASLKSVKDPVIPDEKLSSRNFLELISQFVMGVGDNVMGKENRKYLPFVASLFFYLLFSNLLGLIPGFLMPTDQFSFNLGVALVVFLMYNIWGVKEVGIVNYVKHLFGGSSFMSFPMILIGCALFCIELISHCVRPLSLSLRLFGNMTGDHLVLGVFTDLTKFAIPVIFYGLGAFVCFMQAFVFTMLTMVYIRFAVAHEEDH